MEDKDDDNDKAVPALPAECKRYLSAYEATVRSPGARDDGLIDSMMAALRQQFADACHRLSAADLATFTNNCAEWTVALIGSQAQAPSHLWKDPHVSKGSRQALAPLDRAFVFYWNGLGDSWIENTHEEGTPDLEIECDRIEGYEEILSPQSTGATVITFWKSRDGAGHYWVRLVGGCIALYRKWRGPFIHIDGYFHEQPRGVQCTRLIRGVDWLGIVFPDHVGLPHEGPRWTPSDDDVRAAEELLGAELARSHTEIWAELASYKRQYAGLLVDDKRIVWVNAFGQDSCAGTYWMNQIVLVQDGGRDYFNAKCDVESGRCFDLWVNSEA